MARKDSARGEDFTRWVAGALGWRRRRKGETSNGHDDIVEQDGGLTPVSIECKAYATIQLRSDWVEQARRNAGDRPWAIVQRPKGWRYPVATVDFRFLSDLLQAAGIITNQEGDAHGFDDEGHRACGAGPESDRELAGRT